MLNSEIVMAQRNLMELIGKKEKYPVKFSYALTRNLKALEPLAKDYQEELNKLLDQYNVKDETGEPAYKKDNEIRIAEEHQEAWEKEVGELLAIDVEFSPHKVGLEDFPEKIEPETLLLLDFMIAE